MERISLLYNQEHKRIQYGLERLRDVLLQMGFQVHINQWDAAYQDYRKLYGKKIFVGTGSSGFVAWLKEERVLRRPGQEPGKEGFCLDSCPGDLIVVEGTDETGCLYGCLQLSEQIQKKGRIPEYLAFTDSPRFELRGPCIGLQKTRIEPPRLTYEYPITPERFPWFYDKALWEKQLDAMVRYRCNVLYLWSGHPFASLVKVADYPEALEVTEEEFLKNQELFRWLTQECDRRGIWVVLKFYNIHIPYEFAMAHGLEHKQSSIHPLVADYTFKTIVEFIKAYPHIGLMVCLGEAIRGTQNKTDWFVDTIIPAVKEGVAQAGLEEEPPVILRGHDCDPVAAIEGAKKQYSHLYTMWKYNGESLTTYQPSGEVQEMHQQLRSLCGHHILNIHILANLEPFRYLAPSFIQKCVQAGENRLGGNGLHLYPLFYWDWPVSPDKTEERLLQLDRDWVWYEAWFRYAWNPYRDEDTEKMYWVERFCEEYGCSRAAAKLLLDAWEAAGECAPRILGRVGITEGNRQTYSLGMTLSQLTHVNQYRPNRQMWQCLAAQGEQPDEYVRKELNGETHLGETPADMVKEVRRTVEYAWRMCCEAKEMMTKAAGIDDELSRVCGDIQAIYELSISYCHKVQAALHILAYKYTMDETCRGNITLLEKACEENEKALKHYRKLTELTKETYLWANSMQTPQRKIPFPDGEKFGHWENCLPLYEKEQENLKQHVGEMKQGHYPAMAAKEAEKAEKLPEAEFELISLDLETYVVGSGEAAFQNGGYKIIDVIPELTGLKGLRMNAGHAFDAGQKVILNLGQDSQILIGYLDAKDIQWLQVPDLETDTHADDQGGLAVICQNAMVLDGCPPVHIHSFHYKQGKHEIYLGTGGFVIAGVIPETVQLSAKSGDLSQCDLTALDWLYEA